MKQYTREELEKLSDGELDVLVDQKRKERNDQFKSKFGFERHDLTKLLQDCTEELQSIFNEVFIKK